MLTLKLRPPAMIIKKILLVWRGKQQYKLLYASKVTILITYFIAILVLKLVVILDVSLLDSLMSNLRIYFSSSPL